MSNKTKVLYFSAPMAHSNAKLSAKLDRKALRTLVLSSVFGPQSNKSNEIQRGMNDNTKDLCQDKAQRKAFRASLASMLARTGWEPEKQAEILAYFDKTYSRPQAVTEA